MELLLFVFQFVYILDALRYNFRLFFSIRKIFFKKKVFSIKAGIFLKAIYPSNKRENPAVATVSSILEDEA